MLSASGPGSGGLSSNVLNPDGTLGPEVVSEKVTSLVAGAGGVYSFALGNYELAVLTSF